MREIMTLLADAATRQLLEQGIDVIKILRQNGRLTPEAVRAVVQGIEPLKRLAASGVPADQIMRGIRLLVEVLTREGGLEALEEFVAKLKRSR